MGGDNTASMDYQYDDPTTAVAINARAQQLEASRRAGLTDQQRAAEDAAHASALRQQQYNTMTTSQLAGAQLEQSQAQSEAQLREQQREFGIQQDQSAQTLANTKALQAKAQADADHQAILTEWYGNDRRAALNKATQTVNDAFGSFTPDYYSGFTKAYTDHYQPAIEQQYGAKSNDINFGLARSGNMQAQTAADQFQNLNTTKGTVLADLNNSAMAATNTLRGNVVNAKNSMMAAANSDATLGSPITPGSADAIHAQFNTTANALSNLKTTAGDTITTLQATPQYSSLGTLFGGLASTGAAAISGNNNYNAFQAYSAGANPANPTASSGSIR